MNGLIEQSYTLNVASSNPTLSFYILFNYAPHVQATSYRNGGVATPYSGQVTTTNVHLYVVDATAHVEQTFYGCVNVIGY